jgi:hypothetical protein
LKRKSRARKLARPGICRSVSQSEFPPALETAIAAATLLGSKRKDGSFLLGFAALAPELSLHAGFLAAGVSPSFGIKTIDGCTLSSIKAPYDKVL